VGWAASVAEAKVGGRPFLVITGLRGLKVAGPTSEEAHSAQQDAGSAAHEQTADERGADERTAQQRVQLLLRAPTAAMAAEAFAVAARALLVAYRWLQSSPGDGSDTHYLLRRDASSNSGWAVGGGGAWEMAAHVLLMSLMATGDGEQGEPGPLQAEREEQNEEEEEEGSKAASSEGKVFGRSCQRCGLTVEPLVSAGNRAPPGSRPWQRVWCPNLPWPAVRAAAGRPIRSPFIVPATCRYHGEQRRGIGHLYFKILTLLCVVCNSHLFHVSSFRVRFRCSGAGGGLRSPSARPFV
jgi:hypothetical protein